jgi:hypothetical protein
MVDYTDSKHYRGFGPRWPAMEPSKGTQRRIVHWTATDEAKAIPNPYPRGDYKKGDKNTMTKREFWNALGDEDKAVMRQFADVFDAQWEE